MIAIKLTQGKVALIDECDLEKTNFFNWSVHDSGNGKLYARASVPGGKRIYLHRLVLPAPDDFDVDHIDGNGLNCTRGNLRAASRMENIRNSKKRRTNKSGYKGVHLCKQTGRWRASITVNYKDIKLGRFATPQLAHAAYVAAAARFYGNFARLQ